MGTFQRIAAVANSAVRPMVLSPHLGGLVGRWMTVITYTGRRSGRTFSTPVNYKRQGDQVTIEVMLPDQKQWWRNFVDEAGPISLRLDGQERTGSATAVRDSRGKVKVNIALASAT